MKNSLRRSLALPHRAMRHSRINWLHTFIGVLALITVVFLVTVLREPIWEWQFSVWRDLGSRIGVEVRIDGLSVGWTQTFLITTPVDALITSTAFILSTFLVLRSTFQPAIKGFFVILTLPLFLYSLVVWMRGAAPLESLSHTGPEWLYGEVYLWCLIPIIYAFFIFPIPMSLHVKVFSLMLMLGMSVVWRTAAPIVYMIISISTQGVLAIQGWMTLGPWGDFLYIVPFLSITIALHKGGGARDYRT